MSKLDNIFTLSPNKKPSKDNPIVFRRNKLIRGINKQIQNINDLKQGLKVTNTWYWIDENNNFYLSIKYGKNELELSKNKYSIMCKNIDEILDTLNRVKTMTEKGHFDLTLTNLSNTIRSNFKPTTT